jgi:hypothetical protein
MVCFSHYIYIYLRLPMMMDDEQWHLMSVWLKLCIMYVYVRVAYVRLGREDAYSNHQRFSYLFLSSHIITPADARTNTYRTSKVLPSIQRKLMRWEKEEASWLHKCILFLSFFLSFLLLKAFHHLYEWKAKTNKKKKKKKKKTRRRIVNIHL